MILPARPLLRWLLAAACAWPNPLARAADTVKPGEKRYRLDHWKTEHGLPHNSIECLHQTRDGYLWASSPFGLARFDGFRFTVFNRFSAPAMRSDACSAMAEDINGALWIGTDDGLVVYQNNDFRCYTTEHGLPHRKVETLWPDPRGGVWVGTDAGLALLRDGHFTVFREPEGLLNSHVRRLTLDHDGQLLIRSSNRQFHWLDPATGRFHHDLPLGAPTDRWLAMLPSRFFTGYWISTPSGLHRVEGGQSQAFNLADGSPINAVNTLYEDHRGGLWIGAREKQLTRLAGELTHFGIGEWPSHHSTSAIHEDREGNVWVGTKGDGLYRLQPNRLQAYTTADNLADNDVWSVTTSLSGGIWAGTRSGVSRIEHDRVVQKDVMNLGAVNVRSVCEDRQGRLWIGTSSRGLFQFHNGRCLDLSDQLGHHAAKDVRVIFEDRQGRIWIAHRTGLLRVDDGVFQAILSPTGAPLDRIRAILEDRHGSFWFATFGSGIHRWREGEMITYTTKDGLSGDFIWSLHEDSDGALWIGTDTGLNRFAAGHFHRFDVSKGLAENMVNHLLEDDVGSFWLSGLRGIYRITKSDLNAVAAGQRQRVHCVTFGEADGMLSSETNGENQPAGCKDRAGRLWFPTNKGVVCIDPAQIQDHTLPPPVVIEQVWIDEQLVRGDRWGEPGLATATDAALDQTPFARGESHARYSAAEKLASFRVRDGHLQLPAGRARVLKVLFTANSFVDPARVGLNYRLVGHDPAWQTAGNGRVAYYTNLRPGKYEFQVIACNSHGYWNVDPEKFAFQLAPYFYQTYWFYLAVALAAVGAAACVLQLRIRVLTKIHRLEQQHLVDSERTRIARDIHDDLGSSLTRISLLSELASRNAGDPGQTRSHIEKITGATRGLFRSLDEIIWTTSPKNDTLESLVNYVCTYGQDYLRLASIRCRMEIPPCLPHLSLPSNLRHHVFLAAKEAFHNVVKHSSAAEARIRVALAQTQLSLSIEDDGVGLPGPGLEPHNLSPEPSAASRASGRGLLNMQQRLQSIGGELLIESAGGHGTRVIMNFPLPAFQRRQSLEEP